MKKICFAFLTKGNINNELLWYNYLNKLDNIEILIHCNNIPNFKYLNNITNNIFVNEVKTSWGRLQKVQNFLLDKAKKLNCDKFIILSDSCLPIRKFNYLLNILNNEKSFIDNCEAWDNSRFPKNKYEYKLMANQQWVIIDKKHYDIFLYDDIKEHFENDVILPEESYFSTVMEKNGLNNDDNVIKYKTTYVDWGRSADGNSPYIFGNEEHDEEIIDSLLKNENILFVRKVAHFSNIDCNFIKKIINLI